MPNAEEKRLTEAHQRSQNWKRWGPYLSERQWGTVREDYSPYGTCWDYFPHDHARSRAYRWGEDGLLGITDRQARLCFALALWNGKDPILKERLYGLNGNEGNHGEDVKELYYYLDSSPTHSYLKALYKYPQAEFPYESLLAENQRRNRTEREFELEDSGVFDEDRYFDVQCEYAKNSPNDILIRVRITNHADRPAVLHFLPTLWFRNTWTWDCNHEGCSVRPSLSRVSSQTIKAAHPSLGTFHLVCDEAPFETLITQNETNEHRLFNAPVNDAFTKDAFHTHIIEASNQALAENPSGTKASPHYKIEIEAKATKEYRFRLTIESETTATPFGRNFDQTFEARISETNEFFQARQNPTLSTDEQRIVRQGYAGLLWTKQFYHYVVQHWQDGDPAGPPPPDERRQGRNKQWRHFYARDILSMPDKWEYPWFAAWDSAFHMIPFAQIDPEFAKSQMSLFLREWYLHPNGQLPAYEFAFDDVNPPVHAWAVWRIYKITGQAGKRDRRFLESAFQKLLLNFTWWVNRKDENGNNLFGGGFLGLDNIGPFDRSKPFPGGGTLIQADGTAWMAFYCLTMLSIALELANDDEQVNSAYGDMASKFLEHFVQISEAFNHLNGNGLWDEEDSFYYDCIKQTNGETIKVKTRSLVGLLPLIAVEVVEMKQIKKLPGFYKRFQWFVKHQPELSSHLIRQGQGDNERILLMLTTPERLKKTLNYVCSEDEFLSSFGIRSLSKFHETNPSQLSLAGETLEVRYTPGESNTHLFGGNSNWRGPIWFPVNYLLLEALERYHHFYGESLTNEFPALKGTEMNCGEIAVAIQNRLIDIFRFNQSGYRPCHGPLQKYTKSGDWSDLLLFHEYFDGDNARGLGASHQTGWTALVIRLLEAKERGKTEAPE